MQRSTVQLGHRERNMTGLAWQGGEGSPVVLIHGAWAGARAHWSPVWDALAQRHRVIAPELPDFFPGSGEAKHSYADYADWVAEVMRSLGCEPAVVVGNSLGATIAWTLAARHPEACKALVLVDGGPPPVLAPWLRWMMVRTPLRRVVQKQMNRQVFGREALATGFADPAQAPAEFRNSLRSPDLSLASHLMDVFLNSTPPAQPPRQPTLVVWGAQDRLPHSDVEAGRSLHQQIPGSRFVAIEGAGHLPQVEQPQRFLQAIEPSLA